MRMLKAAIGGIIAMFVMILAFILLIGASVLFGVVTGLAIKGLFGLSPDQGYGIAVGATIFWCLLFMGAGIGIADKK